MTRGALPSPTSLAMLGLVSSMALACLFDPPPADLSTTSASTGPGPGMTGTATDDLTTFDPTTTAGPTGPADDSTGEIPPTCGNGIVDGSEECDGGGGETATCNADCTMAACGDGIVNATAGEACDDGGESATCDANCTMVECGDSTHNATAGEECDDGGFSPGCDPDCTFVVCGDDIVNPNAGEECDEGGETATCDPDCTSVACNDGVLNMTAGEVCDDGVESALCDPDCSAAECGDGVLNETAGELCDDGNMNPDDECNNNCVPALGDCQFVNGYNWCFNPNACGEPCNAVCAAYGLTPVADQMGWFAAQDEPAECTALAAAFGLVGTTMASYSYGCLEDSGGDHSMTPLFGPLLCSTYNGCPANHLTNMDQIGVACNAPDSRRSICPCE